MNCQDCEKDCTLYTRTMTDCVSFYWQGCDACWNIRDAKREHGENWKYNGGQFFKNTTKLG